MVPSHILLKKIGLDVGKNNNTDSVKYSQDQLCFKLPSELIPNRAARFIAKLQALE